MIHTITPMLADGALQFAFQKATPEGKTTICALILVSLFSWTVIITKTRQLFRARKAAKKFFTAFRASRDPMDIYKRQEEFDGAPAYEVYFNAAEEVTYHLKNNPVKVKGETKISSGSYDTVRVTLERSVGAEA